MLIQMLLAAIAFLMALLNLPFAMEGSLINIVAACFCLTVAGINIGRGLR